MSVASYDINLKAADVDVAGQQASKDESLEMQLLRGQYEREKRLLDQKVRQIAELEST